MLIDLWWWLYVRSVAREAKDVNILVVGTEKGTIAFCRVWLGKWHILSVAQTPAVYDGYTHEIRAILVLKQLHRSLLRLCRYGRREYILTAWNDAWSKAWKSIDNDTGEGSVNRQLLQALKEMETDP